MDTQQEARHRPRPTSTSDNNNHNNDITESNAHNNHTEHTPLLSDNSHPSNKPSRYSDPNSTASTVEEGGVGHGGGRGRTAQQPSSYQVTRARLLHWNRVYSRSVKVVGFLLLLSLLIVSLSPWAAQRVLDRAMVLEIEQTEIYDMDETGFQINLQTSIHLDSSRDGFLGLTKILEVVARPTLTIEPTTLSLAVPLSSKKGTNKRKDSADDHTTFFDMAEFEVEGQQMQMGETLKLNISTHVVVTDSTLMASFFGKTLESSTVDLIVRGAIRTKLGPLWYVRLQINRLVTLEGLKGVQDATLVSMALPDNHPLGGIIMSGSARINNPSRSVSLRMGPISFGIYIPTKAHPETDFYKIAEMDCQGLQLLAGQPNSVELSGRLFHLEDWSLSERSIGKGSSEVADNNRGAGSEKQLLLSELLSTFIRGDNSTIQVRALAKDPKIPPWLAEAFRTIVLSMTFPGSPNKDDFIRAIGMQDLRFDFSDERDTALLTGKLSSELVLPPNVTFPIKLLKMKPMVNLRSSKTGLDMATLDIYGFLPTVSQQDGTTLKVDLDLRQIRVSVLPGRLKEFNRFLNTSFTEEWVEIGIAGDALAVVETGLGTFELGPIAFEVATKQKVTFNCIGYPAANGAMGVSIAGAITKLASNESTYPLWSGVVPGTTSAVEYSYVELSATGAAVKTEAFTRKLNQTTDTQTDNEFFDRPTTKWDIPRLPYTYLATYPSKSKAFKEDQIATIHLNGPAAAIDAMNNQPQTEAEVRVTFRFLNSKTVYTQNNITLKTSGKSSKEFAKQSYKISFDGDYNQTFFGRPNLKLRSMATEPTYIREKLYIDMLNSVGVPTQQGSYVRLFINNMPYGLFLMVDDIKKSFIKQTVYGGENNIIPGSLIQANAPAVDTQADLVWKGATGASYNKDAYTMQILGDNNATEPLAQLIQFMADLKDYTPGVTADPVGYWTSRLDLDGFLRNMALEYLMGAFDNYWMAGSNYFLYFNKKLGGPGKWQWLPTDFDGTFGNGAEINTKASYKVLYDFKIDHPLVSKLIINTPQINTMFTTVLKEIVSTAFKPEAMNARIDGLHKMISADAQWDFTLPRRSPGKDLKFTFDDFNNNLVNITKEMSGALKPWVADRATAVSTELGFTIPAGTADRVAPPPRPGKGKGGKDDDDDGGNASTENAAASSSVMMSGMALVAMFASCLMMLA
ncbi:hypothetical protein BGZ83_004231 [Gryganskiella cystojenkinii]|nr:hypothetical protein BGZ83_004231 [Gryganskiella cystojenkinii]